MTLTAAMAVVLVSTVIFPLFMGSTWFYAGIGAVIVVAGFGALSRIRTLPPAVCLLITSAGLLLYLNLAFEASRSLLKILPTPASLTALGSLVHAGMNDASRYAPGAPNVAGLVLLAAGGVGITAVVTDLIAVRMRSAALAGLPLLVLFTVPVTMSTGRSELATVIPFCLGTSGYLAMLSADGRERIRLWGRLISLWRSHDGELREFGASARPGQAQPPLAANGVPANGAPPNGAPPNGQSPAAAGTGGTATAARSAYRVLRGPDTRALAAAGRRVGAASIVLALCAPLLVPGLHASKLLSSDWGFGGGGGGTVLLPNPLSATAKQLSDSHYATVLTYTTTASPILQANYPQYLQQYVYYVLTDSTSSPWELFPSGVSFHSFSTDLPGERGLTVTGAPVVTTSITVAPGAVNSGNGVNVLPAPFPPLQISGETGSWDVDPSTLMVITRNGTLANQSYRVMSHDMDPSEAQLKEVPLTVPDPQYTQLTADYHQAALRRIALEHTEGAENEFQKANDLAVWLGQDASFSYNLYDSPITSASSLLNFLTKTKAGDCVQYAFAFTVLARLLGLPTRLATGYTEGQQSGKSGHYVVRNTDAHAWPEVYFQGYGWLDFEPTPEGQGTATPPGYSNQGSSTSLNPVTLPSGVATAPPTGPKGKGGKLTQISNFGNNPGGGSASKLSAGTPWTAILLAVLAAIALAGGLITLAAPTAARALSSRSEPRPRPRLGAGAALLALVVAGVVAIALYRLMSRTTGLDLQTGWATVGIAFGAAAATALAVPTAGRILLRRWRWMRAGDDATRAHAAWLELRADLADFGVGYLPSESPRALASRVTSTLTLPEPAVEAVGRIAIAEERATYAARPADSQSLRRDGAMARHGIASASGRGARWRSWIFPASVMNALADAMARVANSWTSRTWLRWNPDRL